jgi:hypothetical protein
MPEVALQLLQTDMQRLEDRMRDEKREAFEPLGWQIESLDTSRNDPAHLESPEDPPPDEAAVKRLRRKR